ncbi:MAG: hypothetical protein WC364_04895 [Eubacteriales bacterium]|jgi:hypothetical protein
MPTDDQVKSGIFGDTGTNPAPANDQPGQTDLDKTDTPEGGDNQQQSQQPERLYAGKYKTIEELEAAYKEAQRDFHGDRQDRAEMKRQLDELKAALAPKKPETDPKAAREKLIERLYEEPDVVIEEVAGKIADRKVKERLGDIEPDIQQVRINNQVSQFMAAVPDAHEYDDDMATIVKANPEIMKLPDWLEKAYFLAKTARLEAILAGKDKSTPSTDVKRAAQMPAGGKGEPPARQTEEEKLKSTLFGSPGGEKRKMFDY